MNNRRKLIVALGASALTAPFASFAQQPKIYRIGILSAENASGYRTRLEAFRAGLRDFGYVEGKNIVIEFRWAEGKYERLPELAAELVSLKPDLLVTFATQAAFAAKRVTTTIPIVVSTTGDAVDTGLVASLARPGGNITGSTFFGRELIAKRLELLKEALPHITRVAVLLNPAHQASGPDLRASEIAARSLKLEVQPFEVRAPSELESAFSAMAKRRIEAVVVPEQPIFIVNAKTITNLAVKQRLASSGFTEFAVDGGLIGYGVNLVELYRRGAYFVDRILKGAKPADLPFERATKFELVVNMKTAKALGIKIPQSILVRADMVIDQ
jgi:putative ABC transport system substrate-binding protein